MPTTTTAPAPAPAPEPIEPVGTPPAGGSWAWQGGQWVRLAGPTDTPEI